MGVRPKDSFAGNGLPDGGCAWVRTYLPNEGTKLSCHGYTYQ